MFYHKIEILHMLNPFDMSLIQLLLFSHKLQCMIVIVQDKFLWDQLMPPFLQCLNDSIELLVISGVLHFHFIHLLAEIRYRPVFLTQDCPDCKSTCIAFHLECLSKIWQHQNCSFRNLPLQQIKNFLGFFYPVKRLMSFLHYVHHRYTNFTEIPDEFSIESSQSMKTSHLKYILR
jgi:hypothetical protein